MIPKNKEKNFKEIYNVEKRIPIDEKEQAIILVGRFYDYVNYWGNDGNVDYDLAKENAKKCALILVEYRSYSAPYIGPEEVKFWKEVKQEIEQL